MSTQARARAQAVEALRAALREYLAAVDGFDEAVADRLGLSRTDLRCVDLLERRGTMTAGALAEAVGLSTGAVTFLLDRLEEAGMVRRTRDPSDRRRVLVELCAAAGKRAFEAHRPMIEDMRALVARYRTEELDVVCRFLNEARDIYAAHAPLLRKGSRRPCR